MRIFNVDWCIGFICGAMVMNGAWYVLTTRQPHEPPAHVSAPRVCPEDHLRLVDSGMISPGGTRAFTAGDKLRLCMCYEPPAKP